MAGEEDRLREGEEEEVQEQDITENENSMSYMLTHANETPEAAHAGPETGKAAPETAETAEEKAAREAAEEEAAIAARSAQPEKKEEEEPAPDSPEGRLKAAQAKMHEATTEAAREREARERLEAELEALKSAKPPETEPPAEVKPDTVDERKAKLAAATKAANLRAAPKLRALDDQDPEYEEKWAAIMGEAQAEALIEAGIGVSSLSEEEVAKIAQKQWDTANETARLAKAKADEDAKNAAAWLQLTKKASDSGLDMTPGSAADIVMASLETEIPKRNDLKGKTVAELEDWLISETAQKLGQVVKQTEEQRQAAIDHQNNNRPMARSNPGPVPASTKRQTFSEMITELSP